MHDNGIARSTQPLRNCTANAARTTRDQRDRRVLFVSHRHTQDFLLDPTPQRRVALLRIVATTGCKGQFNTLLAGLTRATAQRIQRLTCATKLLSMVYAALLRSIAFYLVLNIAPTFSPQCHTAPQSRILSFR